MKFFILKIAVCLLFFSCGEQEDANQINHDELNNVEDNDTIKQQDEFTESVGNQYEAIVIDTNYYWLNSNIVRAELYFYAAASHELIIDKNGKWHDKIFHKYDTVINKIELKKMINMLTFETDFIGQVSECFDPHHAIVLKDNNGEVKGHFSICFDCSNYSSSQQINHIPISYFESLFKKYHFPLSREEIRDEVKDFFDKNPSLVTDSH